MYLWTAGNGTDRLVCYASEPTAYYVGYLHGKTVNIPLNAIEGGQDATRPGGWKDPAMFGTAPENYYVSPEVATVLENIRDQVNGNTLADTLNAANKGFGIVKEATLGGSTYHLHLVQEAMQVGRITRQTRPVSSPSHWPMPRIQPADSSNPSAPRAAGRRGSSARR